MAKGWGEKKGKKTQVLWKGKKRVEKRRGENDVFVKNSTIQMEIPELPWIKNNESKRKQQHHTKKEKREARKMEKMTEELLGKEVGKLYSH